MNTRPPLLPVLVGVGLTGLGLLNGCGFAVWTARVLIANAEMDASIPVFAIGLLGLLSVFSLLLVPAGIGILIHRPWGQQLAQGMVLGATLTGLLGMVPGVLGLPMFPGVINGTFAWGFLSGLVAALTLKIACRFRSMKQVFGEQVNHETPLATGTSSG